MLLLVCQKSKQTTTSNRQLDNLGSGVTTALAPRQCNVRNLIVSLETICYQQLRSNFQVVIRQSILSIKVLHRFSYLPLKFVLYYSSTDLGIRSH